MKPRYVLHEGQPVRVAWIQGKHVGLVQVQPDLERSLNDPHCCQCVFFKCSGTSMFDGELEEQALGTTCLKASGSVYREFPQPLRSGE